MGTYFTTDWFYEKFALPDCRIDVDDREYSVEVTFPASREDREIGRIPKEEVRLAFYVEMPQIHACVLISNVEDDNEDPMDDEDSATALLALKQIIQEKHGCGLTTYWYRQLEKDEPASLPIPEAVEKRVRRFIASLEERGPLCKTMQDAVYTVEQLCRSIAEDLDNRKKPDPLLVDHLKCFTALREAILNNGLPTITEENMFYEIAFNRKSVFVQLYHIKACYSYSCSLHDGDPDDSDYLVVPYRTVLYAEPLPILTCADFAECCGVDQGTVRQWIRRGKLRTAFKSGRDWMIPSATRPPERGFTPGRYHLTKSVPKEAAERYPFLDNLFGSDDFTVTRGENGQYQVIKNYALYKPVLATLSQEERERFEYDLLEADWAEADLEEKAIPTMIKPVGS